MDEDTLRAFEIANATLAEKGRSFYWARYLLGPIHAARATRLYGFCRYVDDLADEATSVEAAKQALGETSRDIAKGVSEDPAVIDMLRLMHECAIDPVIVQELINGVTSDLDTVRISNESDLVLYCYQVAGTVGVMMCNVLDVHDIKAYAHAIDLGIAMQLTNICRDVSEDAQNNRRYLPASYVSSLDPALLIYPVDDIQIKTRDALAELLELADQYYQSGEDGLGYLPLGARSGILVAARVYRAIGTELRHQNYAYWTKRAVVSKMTKVFLTIKALFLFGIKKSLWMPVYVHKSSLHSALTGLTGNACLPDALNANGIVYAKKL